MSTTGISWVVGRYSGASPYAIGGRLVSPAVAKKAESTQESGTGQRKLVLNQVTNMYWTIDFRIKLQKFATYLTAYAMITAEGTLPSHNIYTYDGITKKGFTSCLVDKSNVNIAQTGAIEADFSLVSLGVEDKDLTITPDSEAPMTKAAVTELTVGDVITKWTAIKFGIDNDVVRQASGNADVITDIYARSPKYSFVLDFLKAGVLKMGYDTTLKKTVQLKLTDNQSSPVTTTFTWADMAVTENQYRVEELGITFERLTCTGDSMVLS